MWRPDGASRCGGWARVVAALLGREKTEGATFTRRGVGGREDQDHLAVMGMLYLSPLASGPHGALDAAADQLARRRCGKVQLRAPTVGSASPCDRRQTRLAGGRVRERSVQRTPQSGRCQCSLKIPRVHFNPIRLRDAAAGAYKDGLFRGVRLPDIC